MTTLPTLRIPKDVADRMMVAHLTRERTTAAPRAETLEEFLARMRRRVLIERRDVG